MISDEAVDAAAGIVRLITGIRDTNAARLILEAAAPYMLAEAKAESLEEAAEWLTIPSAAEGGLAASWLRTRADTYRSQR